MQWDAGPRLTATATTIFSQMNKALYCLSFLLLLSPLLEATAEPGDWYLAPAVVFTDDDGARNLDDSVAGGQLSLGRQLSERVAVEVLLAYSDIDGFPGQEHFEAGLNVLTYAVPDRAFSPFLLLGAGHLGTETSTGSKENRPMATAGLGFRWTLGDSAVAIRGEYRLRLAWESNNNLTDRIATLGLQFAFGGATKVFTVHTDNDHDGVADIDDFCWGTGPGVVVNGFGCEFDDDNDGVVNSKDDCPHSSQGVAVNEFGCSVDNDGDGVPNSIDRCPNSVAHAEVDASGCELDDDGDSVVNRLDQCPQTTAGARVDVNGCEFQDVIELPGVNFASNSDRLLPGAEQVLAYAAATLRKHPDLIVEVVGHTDSAGAAELNLGLSERRAHTVRDYLLNAGVQSANLTAKGLGEFQPVADNATAYGRAKNRRVELRILDR